MPSHTPDSSHLRVSQLELIAMAGLAGATLVVGTIGHLQHAALQGHHTDLLTAIYHAAELLVFHSPHLPEPIPPALQAGRWMGLVVALWAASKIAFALLRHHYRNLRLGRLRSHTVICGLGERALPLLRCWRSENQPVVVIDRDPPPDLVRLCEKAGAHVITGDATQRETLELAGVPRAQRLVALCPEDSVNCEIATQARSLDRPSSAGKLACHVHLTDADLRYQLRRHVADAETNTEITFFDLFDAAARRLLREEMPLDRAGIGPNDPHQPHLIVIGCGRAAQALLLRAVQIAHFANGRRLRVSIIDRGANAKRDALFFRHPAFPQLCDVEFLQCEAESPAARTHVEAACCDSARLTSIAICFDNEVRAAELALKFLPLLESTGARLAVRLAHGTGLAGILDNLVSASGGRGRPIVAFGMYSDFCLPSLLDRDTGEELAEALHNSFVAARISGGAAPSEPKLRAWSRLAENLRDSNRQQAEHIFVKLRAIGCPLVAVTDDPRPALQNFTPPEVELLARMEHARWVTERLLDDWTLGPKPTDHDKKTSPSLVDWAALPEAIRQYDRDFVTALPGLLAKVGRKIVR